jgi:hypothetical protein
MSTDQKRGTCPNDRRELFNPESIDVARFNSPAPQSWLQSQPAGHSLYYSLVYDLIDSTMDDICRFREAWDQSTRGSGDGYHDNVCSFFALAQGPHVLQANLRKLHELNT